MKTLAIIGGGQAGATVAAQLRDRGFDDRIVLIGEEEHLPYERPPLSKEAVGGEEVPLVLPEASYVERGIELVLGTRVRQIELGGRGVVTGSGNIAADWAVLAPGSSARKLGVPGEWLSGVLQLRTIEDARLLCELAEHSGDVVIIGAGLIGTEVAAALAAPGRAITVLDPAEAPLASVVGHEVAARIRRAHTAAGVRFVRASVLAIEGRESVQSVSTSSGERIAATLVLIAVGAVPRLEVAVASDLLLSNGVHCDAEGRTSRSGVYAAGDIAEWPHPGFGRLRVEHWKNAVDQAAAIAGSVVGAPPGDGLVPWFWTDQYTDRIEVVGRFSAGTLTVNRGDPESASYLSLRFDGPRLVGAVGVNCARDIRTAGRLIGTARDIDIELVRDEGIELRRAVI